MPEFTRGDVTLALTLNGKKVDSVPEQGEYGVVVSCDKATGLWDYDNWSLNIKQMTNVKVKCSLDFIENFSGKIIKMAATDKDIAIDKHEATEQTPKQIDYRYIGANPNNYVCLKDNNQECSEEELYRIIGVIPTQSSADGPYEYRLKLVKYESYVGPTAEEDTNDQIKGYRWSGSSSNQGNNWEKSTLNTEILNKEYYESINDCQKYIEKAKWYLGSIAINSADVSELYGNNLYLSERSNKTCANCSGYPIYTISNIGLIYFSDFVYATSGGSLENRKICLNTSNHSQALENWNSGVEYCKANDWLQYKAKKDIWTITPESVGDTNSVYVGSTGYIGNQRAHYFIHSIYPTFYLKSSVKYLSGTGEQSNPYRITLE